MSISGVFCTAIILEAREADLDCEEAAKKAAEESAKLGKTPSLQAFNTGDAKKGAGLFKVSNMVLNEWQCNY